jgi:hypothetical protein
MSRREFEPVTRRHSERTRAHSETRGPCYPDPTFLEDFNFADFDSPPPSIIKRNDYWDKRIARKDSLDSQGTSTNASECNKKFSKQVSRDEISCKDLDELNEEFIAEYNAQQQPPPPPVYHRSESR